MFLNTAKLHYCQYYYQNYIHLDEDVIHAHSSFCIAIIHVSIIVVLVMLKATDTFLTWIIIFVAVIVQFFDNAKALSNHHCTQCGPNMH